MAVLIFKPVETCNANCIYCNVIEKNNQIKMDYETMELVFKRINEYLKNNPKEMMHFTWHGGEVTTLGEDFIAKAIELQDKWCADTKQRIRHLVQSNLTKITQGYIDLFRQLGVESMGTSYEPIPGMRGIGKQRNSNLYNTKFMEGINLLEKNNISWGAIYVVHKKSLGQGKQIFDFFANLNPARLPNYNMVHIFGRDELDLAITGEEFADFLGEFFQYYWENRDRFGGMQPFSRFENAIIHNQPIGLCEFSGQCSNQWLYIGPDGSASHCGIAGDYTILQYGNIKDRTIDELLHDEQRTVLRDRIQYMKEEKCTGCRFWGVCRSGCPSYAYLENGDFKSRAPDCSAVQKFVTDYFEPITGYRCELPPEKDPYT